MKFVEIEELESPKQLQNHVRWDLYKKVFLKLEGTLASLAIICKFLFHYRRQSKEKKN